MADRAPTAARLVLAALAATVAAAVVLVTAFEPSVQEDTAAELVARADDARAFLAADYVFVVVYAVLSPLAIWRFGAALGEGRVPRWIAAAALLLVAAGIADASENTLLLASTGSVSEGRVDAAHALAIPKSVLFVAGALLALAVNVRAARTLRTR